MKNLFIKYSHIILGTFLFCLLAGCKKFVDVDAPSEQVVSTSVFSSDGEALSAVVGLYSTITSPISAMLNGGIETFTGLSGDELDYTGTASTYKEFYTNSISTNNNYNQTYLWRYAYNYIYQANLCIENLQNSKVISDDTKRQLTGEMKFMRALCYFHMVNLYGPVPLETSSHYEVNAVMPRTLTDSVYQQIIMDLKDAKQLMKEEYVSSDRTRPNKWTAAALLAKTYLYHKDWDSSVKECDSIINSGTYSLENINNVFLATSTETIFQLLATNSSGDFNSALGYLFIPSTSATAKPAYTLSHKIMLSFESADNRSRIWTNVKTISGTSYVYPFKYKVKYSNNKTEYNIFFRLAEVYLIRAEANVNLGNSELSVADINLIRNRAGLGNYVFNSNDGLVQEIRNERNWELFTEGANRWYDLKRWGIIDSVMSNAKIRGNLPVFCIRSH